MSTPQKPKIIRKENIFKRLRSWPLDLLLGLSESIELMNLESIFNESGTVFAILFNAAYISIKFYRDGAFGDPEFITFVQESHLGHIPSSYFSFKAIFSVQFIVNTIIMFTTFKSVVLFHQPTKPLYEGDSTWLIKSRNASLVRLDVNTDMPEDSDGWIKRSPSPILECRWMLRQWAPSIFSTTIFSWFSPPQVAILYGVDAQNWSYMIPVAYLTAVVVNLTISAYQDLLNDSKILSGQVLQEFTDSLQFNQPVYPASPLPRTKSKFSP